jgi:rifampicin phosphotransferase
MRMREFEAFRHEPPPPDRFTTHGAVTVGNNLGAARDLSESSSEQRQGIGCCAGIVSGIVRVVLNPHGVVLEPGCILVAERTDPGWVMLFPAAAGLLMERGSLLSHSAIVAREMGIPAIVSIAGVTRWLKDGDRVELDGARGVVRKLTSEATASEAHV